jgi:hypothetical protein
MVRRGSTVRVRQRASRKATNGPFVALSVYVQRSIAPQAAPKICLRRDTATRPRSTSRVGSYSGHDKPRQTGERERPWARSRTSVLWPGPELVIRSRSVWDRYCRWARRPSAEAAGAPRISSSTCRPGLSAPRALVAAPSERPEQESREEQVMVVRPLRRLISLQRRLVRLEQ